MTAISSRQFVICILLLRRLNHFYNCGGWILLLSPRYPGSHLCFQPESSSSFAGLFEDSSLTGVSSGFPRLSLSFTSLFPFFLNEWHWLQPDIAGQGHAVQISRLCTVQFQEVTFTAPPPRHVHCARYFTNLSFTIKTACEVSVILPVL